MIVGIKMKEKVDVMLAENIFVQNIEKETVSNISIALHVYTSS